MERDDREPSPAISDEELAAEAATELPDREEMSVISMGGGAMPPIMTLPVEPPDPTA